MFVFVAILSYFLTASATILDKFLISSKRISHPSVYTFFIGFFSVFTLLIFFPFGFHGVSIARMAGMFFFGALFTFGLLSLFFTFQKNEASRVVPVVGAVTSLVSLFISFLVFGDPFDVAKFFGVGLLIFGGLLISLKFSRKEVKGMFSGFHLAILAGLFLGVAFSAFKKFYEVDSFINVFIWTRMGVFLGALSFLLVPLWRRAIIGSFRGFKKNKEKNTKTGIIFVSNKILGGTGSIVFNLALSLGNVAVVNALVATEYVFVFLFGEALSRKFPQIFGEKRDPRTVLQKIISIAIIGAGVLLVK